MLADEIRPCFRPLRGSKPESNQKTADVLPQEQRQ